MICSLCLITTISMAGDQITSYQIELREEDGDFATVSLVLADETSFVITGLQPETTYE